MKSQKALIADIQGNRIKDTERARRCQDGWRDWAEKKRSDSSRQFQQKELPDILSKFECLFQHDDSTTSGCETVEKEIRTLLYQSNLIDDSPSRAYQEDPDDSKDDDMPPPPPTKRARRHDRSSPASSAPLTPRSVTPTQTAGDPWLLGSLTALANTDRRSFSEHELAVHARANANSKDL